MERGRTRCVIDDNAGRRGTVRAACVGRARVGSGDACAASRATGGDSCCPPNQVRSAHPRGA
jgi:hypothetical protein